MSNSPRNNSGLLMRISVSSHLTHYINPSSEIGPEPMLIPVTGCSVVVEMVCHGNFDFKILGFRAEVIQQTSFQSDGTMESRPSSPHRLSFLSPEEDELVRKAEEAFIPLEIPHFEILLDTHPPIIRPALKADGLLARPTPHIPFTLHANESGSFFLAPVSHNPDLTIWSLYVICEFEGELIESSCGTFQVTGYTGWMTFYSEIDGYYRHDPTPTPVNQAAFDHWDIQYDEIAESLNDQAEFHQAQDQSQEAESLYQQALAIYEQTAGPEHPNTARSLNNLAALYQEQGRYQEAEPLYQRALAIYEQTVGPEHPSTRNIRANWQQLIYKKKSHGRRGCFLNGLFRRSPRLQDHGFVPHVQLVFAPVGMIIQLKQAPRMIGQKRIDQVDESEWPWKQQFTERLERSAANLKEVLDLHTTTVNEAAAWGYSPSPMAERLPDGSIKVTTYHFGGEWQTAIYHTELEVVRSLYGGWDLGEWQAE